MGYCDYGWNHKTEPAFALIGGRNDHGATDGIFYCSLADPVGNSYWTVGANRHHDYGWNIKDGVGFITHGSSNYDGNRDGLFIHRLRFSESYSSDDVGACAIISSIYYKCRT